MQVVKTEIKVKIVPLTEQNWRDFEKLFGEKGACGGCWCMYWRQTAREYQDNKGENNRKAMKKLARQPVSPGLLAYVNDIPAGWCSVSARSSFKRLGYSKILKPVDDKTVWSLPCFFIAKPFRNKGLSRNLINAAIDYCKSKGAKILEAYPVEPNGKQPDVFMYTGIFSAFKKTGFEEVARRSDTRPIVRKWIAD